MIYKVDFNARTKHGGMFGWTRRIHERRAEQFSLRIRHDWFRLARLEREMMEKTARIEKVRQRLASEKRPTIYFSWKEISEERMRFVFRRMVSAGFDPGAGFEVTAPHPGFGNRPPGHPPNDPCFCIFEPYSHAHP